MRAWSGASCYRWGHLTTAPAALARSSLPDEVARRVELAGDGQLGRGDRSPTQFREQFVQAIEAFGLAGFHAGRDHPVARLGCVEQQRLGERRLAAALGQDGGHHRLVDRERLDVVDLREDDALGRDDFAVDPLERMERAVRRLLHETVGAARPEVDLADFQG